MDEISRPLEHNHIQNIDHEQNENLQLHVEVFEIISNTFRLSDPN